MKTVLYSHNEYKCTLISENNSIKEAHSHWAEIVFPDNESVSHFSLNVEGRKWKVLWPNREGEIFSVSEAHSKIRNYNISNGLSISYPSTASCRTLIFLEKGGEGFIFTAPPSKEGRVTEFCINSENDLAVSINISGSNTIWYSLMFKTMKELEKNVTLLRNSVSWNNLPAVTTDSRWQVQVGLIGPDGKTEVPDNKGFNVLADISELMLKELGKDNILHIFGYSMGHDIAYPDYTPSASLGGVSRLEKAIDLIHFNRQKAVFYMNGRIADQENVEKDGLYDSVLKNNLNSPFTEIYHNRNFYVMNPASEKWQNRLFFEAMKLKTLGADGIQLDQLGGRAAPVPAGEIWGKGYIRLINNLHKEGLSLWIQGLSDIYAADWFELTYRNINVLSDGTIRGGTPLGKPDRRLFQISVPDQVLLVPLSKTETPMDIIHTFNKKNIIIDLDLGNEELFLYNPTYMTQLAKLMQKAVLN